jgi:hypothetical protein
MRQTISGDEPAPRPGITSLRLANWYCTKHKSATRRQNTDGKYHVEPQTLALLPYHYLVSRVMSSSLSRKTITMQKDIDNVEIYAKE